MGAPTVTTIRYGVTFTPAAAASFRRAEKAWGRRIDVNSTYRDWNTQWRWYTAWNAYVAGRGPYPGHSRAIHPDLSMHCKGLALDSDDWTRPGFNTLMADHGWIRTAANDPTERHHFEYQSWRDQHRNEPAGDDINVITEQEIDMTTTRYLYTKNAGDGKPAYGIFGEQVPGGSRVSRSVNTAEVWGAIWGEADGAPWKEMSKAQWPRLIAEARVIHEDWVTLQKNIAKAATVNVTGGAVDTKPILDAITNIPAAVVNSIRSIWSK